MIPSLFSALWDILTTVKMQIDLPSLAPPASNLGCPTEAAIRKNLIAATGIGLGNDGLPQQKEWKAHVALVARQDDHVTIAFGRKEVAFYTKPGESAADCIPKPDDPKAASWSRFMALELVLADMLDTSALLTLVPRNVWPR